MTTLIEAARMPPSFTRRRTKVDVCKVQKGVSSGCRYVRNYNNIDSTGCVSRIWRHLYFRGFWCYMNIWEPHPLNYIDLKPPTCMDQQLSILMVIKKNDSGSHLHIYGRFGTLFPFTCTVVDNSDQSDCCSYMRLINLVQPHAANLFTSSANIFTCTRGHSVQTNRINFTFNKYKHVYSKLMYVYSKQRLCK